MHQALITIGNEKYMQNASVVMKHCISTLGVTSTCQQQTPEGRPAASPAVTLAARAGREGVRYGGESVRPWSGLIAGWLRR